MLDPTLKMRIISPLFKKPLTRFRRGYQDSSHFSRREGEVLIATLYLLRSNAHRKWLAGANKTWGVFSSIVIVISAAAAASAALGDWVRAGAVVRFRGLLSHECFVIG
jgi:hypothetical protein